MLRRPRQSVEMASAGSSSQGDLPSRAGASFSGATNTPFAATAVQLQPGSTASSLPSSLALDALRQKLRPIDIGGKAGQVSLGFDGLGFMPLMLCGPLALAARLGR